ncbi:Retrovirus-related Pol polyprotein from transposon [Trichinella patagoniensis]|uniref:RNA-directed DNA polymerase n=1 Tax=Trichinella patagoniensis TaxID=990121 RepID=A0A0V0Z268_9BILA|nr:Retrovirus-related Pol polyprotein from transposon [Trichinella patagoniensis]
MEQQKDPDIARICRWVATKTLPGRCPTGSSRTLQSLLLQKDQLMVKDGILLRKRMAHVEHKAGHQLVVPQTLRQDILQCLHSGPEGGHLGKKKTLWKIRQRFYWPDLSEDVADWCRKCPECNQRKSGNKHHSGQLEPQIAPYPVSRICVDIIGPFQRTERGNKYILTIPPDTAEHAQHESRSGQKELGSRTSSDALGLQKERPRIDGGNSIQSLVWPRSHIADRPHVWIAGSTAANTSGTESRRQKKWYDRRTTDCHFDVNDKVWLAKPKRNKLDKIWDGPYRIVQQAGYSIFKIKKESNPRKQLIVHVDGLKRCYGTNPEIANRSDKTEEQHRSSVNEGQRSHNVIVTTSTGTQRRQNEQITPTNPQPNLPKRIPAKTEMAERLCYGNRTNSLRQTAKKNGVV